MSFHAATIGQLLIVEAFVFFIWLRVLFWAVKNEPPNTQFKKLVATSSGLVITSFAIVALMVIRAVELFNDVHHDNLIIAAYCMLALGNSLFIVSAAIDNSWKQVRLLVLATVAWTSFYIITNLV